MERCYCSNLLCFGIVVVVAFINVGTAYADDERVTCSGIVPMHYREHDIRITDFGGVGDGVSLNTKAFREAISRIEQLNLRSNGTRLYIPPGEYLTGPFNLTSHMTLYLASGAVLKATTSTV